MRFVLIAAFLVALVAGPVGHAEDHGAPAGLVEALGHPDPAFRRYAAWALGRAELSDRSVEALIVALGDRDELTVEYASRALEAEGGALAPRLAAALAAGHVPAPVSDLLVALGRSAVGPTLAVLHRTQDGRVRRTVCGILARIGPEADEAVPALVAMLAGAGHRSEGVHVSTALGQIGAAAVPSLIEMLDRDVLRRELAARALSMSGAAGAAAAPRLAELLRSDVESRVRFTAAQAIGKLGVRDERVTSALLEALARDPSATVKMYAAESLGEVAREDPRTVSALVGALDGADPQVSSRVLAAIGRVGSPAVPELLRAMDHVGPAVRVAAGRGLGLVGSGDDAVTARLVRALGDPDEDVRDEATLALVRIGPSTVPTLEAATHRAGPVARGYAMLALGRMEPPAEASVTTLVRGTEDPAPRVRELAVWALGKIGAAASPAVDRLVVLLESSAETAGLRRTAAWALGNIGPEAGGALAALDRTAGDADETVRQEAAEAVLKIRGVYDYTRHTEAARRDAP